MAQSANLWVLDWIDAPVVVIFSKCLKSRSMFFKECILILVTPDNSRVVSGPRSARAAMIFTKLGLFSFSSSVSMLLGAAPIRQTSMSRSFGFLDAFMALSIIAAPTISSSCGEIVMLVMLQFRHA
tara:strand:- start:7052 stop:7429 length:378 start_codon:yes stop_codon:yes gene_type:complete